MDEIELKNEEVDKEREAKVHEELLQALKNKDEVKIKDLAEQAHPIDLAIAMEDFEDEDISYFASLLSDELLAEIIEQADEDLQNHIMKIMQITRIMQIFQYMSKDNIVDILGNMPADRRKDVVNLMKTGDQKIIRNLLGYEENTAGGIMTLSIFLCVILLQ